MRPWLRRRGLQGTEDAAAAGSGDRDAPEGPPPELLATASSWRDYRATALSKGDGAVALALLVSLRVGGKEKLTVAQASRRAQGGRCSRTGTSSAVQLLWALWRNSAFP